MSRKCIKGLVRAIAFGMAVSVASPFAFEQWAQSCNRLTEEAAVGHRVSKSGVAWRLNVARVFGCTCYYQYATGSPMGSPSGDLKWSVPNNQLPGWVQLLP